MSKTITVRIPNNLLTEIDILASRLSPFRPNVSQAILFLLHEGLQSKAIKSTESFCGQVQQPDFQELAHSLQNK